MSIRVKSNYPTLKHGAYSATDILPGESRAKFKKLHRALIVKYLPKGPLEQHIVAELARLVWRRENLATFRIATIARQPFIRKESPPQPFDSLRFDSPPKPRPMAYEVARDIEEIQAEECAAAIEAQGDRARSELGDLYGLVVSGNVATISYLSRELGLQERLDDMIDRCVKRLLHAKGLGSISASAPEPRLPAPPKAA